VGPLETADAVRIKLFRDWLTAKTALRPRR